jgi:hypothetical protein
MPGAFYLNAGLRGTMTVQFASNKHPLTPLCDDRPFIVLTETKFSSRCIPVWIGTLLTGLGSKKRTHVIMFSP